MKARNSGIWLSKLLALKLASKLVAIAKKCHNDGVMGDAMTAFITTHYFSIGVENKNYYGYVMEIPKHTGHTKEF